MDERQKKLFENIVREHIKSARAVASNFLVKKYHLDVCPATVRNDMLELERTGLVEHPHTSAGRVPTEDGYKLFIRDYVDLEKSLDKNEEELITEALKGITDQEASVKAFAKIISEKSNLGVFVGFSPDNVYYTGLSRLFNQPEFRDYDLIFDLTEMIDHLDEVMSEIYDGLKERQTQIKIGRENPFSSDCSAVMTRAKDILLGILGPMRMDYQKNVALINSVKNII